MNDGSFNWSLEERMIYVVGDGSFTEHMVENLRPLPLEVTVVSADRVLAAIETETAVPDMVILSGRSQTVGKQLLTNPKTNHISQLYVLEQGEETAVWSLVAANAHCDFIMMPFTADGLRLRLQKLLSALPAMNMQDVVEQFPLFDAIDGGIVIFDEAGKILAVNRHVCELYGRSYEEVIDVQVGSFTAEGDEFVKEEALRRVILAKTEGPQRFEWRSLRADGGQIWTEVRVSYVTLAGQPCYVALVQEITNQKQSLGALQEIRGHYGALVTHVYEGIVILQDERVKVDNGGLSTMLGYTVGEVEGSHFLKYVAAAFQVELADLYGRFIGGLEVPYLNEVQLIHQDGHMVDVEITGAHTVYDSRPAVMVVVRDISNRKAAEQALLLSEEKFIKVFEASPSAITLATWPDGRLLNANSEFERLTGFTKLEAIGKLTTELFIPSDERTRLKQLYGDALKHQNIEFLAKHKNGERFPASLSYARIELDEQQCTVAVVNDLRQQKQAKEAMLTSEEKFSKAFHASPDAIVIATWPEGVVLDVNHEFEQMTGYQRDEVIEQDRFDFYTPNERYHILSTLKENPKRRDIEFVSQRKNGEAFPAVLAFDFLEIDGRWCTIEIVRDLSEQKGAEEALRLSEEKFSKAFFASPDSITITTVKEGLLVEANQGFKTVFGYEPSEAIGQTIMDLNIYTDVEELQRVMDQLIHDGFVQNLKLTGRHKLGFELMVNVSMELIDFAGEQCMVTIASDVTEQERMLTALRTSEEKFATIFQFSPNALSITDLQTGQFTEVNESFELISGYPRDEVIGSSIEKLGLYADDEQRLAVRELFLKNGRVDDYEFVTRQKSGQLLFCTISARLIEIGGVPSALVLVRDVTQAKLAQQELQRNEALLRQTQTLAQIGSWSLDLESLTYFWSDVLYDLFGLPLSKQVTYDDYLSHVVPEDLPVVHAATAQAFRSDVDNFPLEHRIITTGGRERHLWIQSYLDRDETGRVIHVHGTAQDISERKRTEEALFKSEEMARAFQEKLRALHEVTIRLSSEPSLDAFFYLSIVLGQEQLGFERLEMFLFDEDQEYLYGAHGADETGRVRNQSGFRDVVAKYPALQKLIQNNVRVREWDQANQRYEGQILGKGWVALAMLWGGDKGIGFLSADNHLTGDAPPPFAKDLLALYGNALGHLLTRRRAELSVERYVKQLQLLQQIDRAILRAESPAAMARSVLEPLKEMLGCHFIDIARYNAEQNIISSLANTLTRPLDSEQFGSVSPKVVAMLAEGELLELDNIVGQDNTAEVIAFWKQHNIQSMFIMPLVDDKLLGVLYIGLNQIDRLSDEQSSVVKQVATQLAVALQQNLLHTRIEVYASQLEHLVEMRTNQLTAKARELEAFTYSVSHDLRAPLRAMDGFSRTLVNNYGADLPSKAQHYLTRIQYNAQKMGRLIDDLLKLSRLGRQEMQFQKIDSGRLVQSVVDELTENDQLEGAGITLLPMPPFYGDDALLKQVWFNLISNAIKYTQKGQRPVIEIGSLQQDDGQTVYYIQDGGIGFDMTYVGKLFGVFQRLHNAADYDGTGIGLATVQRIIHRHGGQIWAEAEVNNGATFYFTLEEQPKENMQSNAE